MLQFHQVSKNYQNGQSVLNNISFSLARGELAFLTGHSGAGKSTLIKLACLLERSNTGQILVASQNVTRLSVRQVPIFRRTMGVIFQNPNLLPERTIAENVGLPLVIAGSTPRDIPKRVRAALDKVKLLDKENCLPAELSCGEQQRVGIARAIVNNPSILLADEPTGNVDPALAMEIMRLFIEYANFGATILVASHDLALLARLKYRVLTLQRGVLVNDGN